MSVGVARPWAPLRAAALVLVIVLAMASTAAPALAASSVEGGSAFNELSRKAQEPETTTTKSTKSTESAEKTAKETKNSKTTIFVGFGAAAVLLLAIAYVIVRDARKNAPAEDPADTEARVNRDLAIQQRKRRAKAKAARRQRKKTRG